MKSNVCLKVLRKTAIEPHVAHSWSQIKADWVNLCRIMQLFIFYLHLGPSGSSAQGHKV